MRYILLLLVMISLSAGAWVYRDAWMALGQDDVEDKLVEVLAAPAKGKLSGAVEDDIPERKLSRPLAFDETLIAPDHFGEMEVNLSEALTKVDLTAAVLPEEKPLVELHGTFKDALKTARSFHAENSDILVPASLIVHKCREFDNGLLAAVELALVKGEIDGGVGMLDLFERIFKNLKPADAARAYMAAGLELGGKKVDVYPEEVTRRNMWLNGFKTRSMTAAPPTEFYLWNSDLEKTHNFMRFFQDVIAPRFRFIVGQMARVVKENPELLARYEVFVNIHETLYRPRTVFTILDVAKMNNIDDANLMSLFKSRADMQSSIVAYPLGLRREQILCTELLPLGLFAGLDMFPELVQRSMIGNVNVISPSNLGRPGWEELQAFALDAWIGEIRTEESNHILLTRAFRERLMGPLVAQSQQFFESQKIEQASPWAPMRETAKYSPRLRVEPVPALYLRLGRNYRLLPAYIRQFVGNQTARKFKRLSPSGPVTEIATEEAQTMSKLMYGLYLISCEDLGTRPNLGSEDDINLDECHKAATDWLTQALDDPVVAVDCRYTAPIDARAVSQKDIRVLQWANLGVRLAKVETSFHTPPKVRLVNRGSLWRDATENELTKGRYLLPVFEVVGLEVRGRYSMPTDQYRKICDENGERKAIETALLAIEPPMLGLVNSEPNKAPSSNDDGSGEETSVDDPNAPKKPDNPSGGQQPPAPPSEAKPPSPPATP